MDGLDPNQGRIKQKKVDQNPGHREVGLIGKSTGNPQDGGKKGK